MASIVKLLEILRNVADEVNIDHRQHRNNKFLMGNKIVS